MNERNDDRDTAGEPRWLRLAADLRAEPAPGTLARVRERLAARERESGLAWVRWLGRPAALATSVALLSVCTWAGNAWVSSSAASKSEGASLVTALLGEDGSFGLGVESDEPSGPTSADSGAVVR